ncbi:protein cordon-bleu isoform X3 [Scophthalmus maximus]|uniref:protein cordon-bleu isoform X3 n=1 Tax=Scophthalmus maximus TaxID=52904 RepID=UPI001FA8E922|nr:protein cordon-bleu isoform X3 [Scophthalmus maximus]
MTESSKAPLGRRMKARAPPPPRAPQPAPRNIFRNTDGGGPSGIESKENMMRPTVDFQLTLPQGHQTSVTEEGSKALMDLLVELCSRYHLNPALHTLELLSPEGRPLGFKPNALLGSLNVACVLIKEKVWEEKVVRRPAPKVPEKTVRLMVNYHGSQKAVVRVNPLEPLKALTPVICDKCEFDPAHVLLLRDGVSRRELPLDKSLTELGIKELYVHDQSLDSFRSSTTSLNRAEKKGFLGIFQFSRRKSKTETTSVDMDDCDDKVIQNTDTQSNGVSTVSRVPSTEDRPSTLGQSQSVMNMSRMSPKAEIKKRQAPGPPEAPTPTMGHTSFEGYQMGLGSESQQRKRKAPAPPPTPASITPGSDDTSASAAPTPDSRTAEKPTQAFRNMVAESIPVSSNIVVMRTIKAAPSKTAAQPATPTASSPTPSSSTTDSLAAQDSSSELSHSLDDSDADLDQVGSRCSTLTSSTASGSVRARPATKSCGSSRMEESEMSSSVAAKSHQGATSASSSRSGTESALNLKLDEVENNRHSAMGTADQPAPPKPRRSPAREPPRLAPSTPAPPSPPTEPTESSSPERPTEVEEAAPQSWLHSTGSSAASGQRAGTEMPEEETVSLGSSSSSGSSSGGSSLPDQGYAASEGTAEGEDSGIVSSPSDTQPTSPDGSLSLDGCGGGRPPGPVRDNSSDSDEGCATWGSRHGHNAISPQAKSGRLKDNYEEDAELTAQLRQTLADFEAGLAGRVGIVSVKETPYSMSTDGNDVPVSVVDMDVPVTAIDEVLEDYERRNIVENEAKSLTRTKSAGSKGLCQQSSTEPQNKNNNACTAAESNKSSSVNTKHPPQPKQHRKSLENKSIGDKGKEKIIETKMKDTDTNGVKQDKQRATSAVKSDVDMRKHSKSPVIKPDPVKSNTESFQEKKPVQPPASQRSVSTERVEEMHRVYQNNSGSNPSNGKITRNVTSRFGMKTFTVVPPKPSVMQAATGNAAVKVTAGAIKIDDQGNMVKVGISSNKVGGSSESGNNIGEESPLLGKAKAFWSSNERQESAVPHGKGQINKAKENMDAGRGAPLLMSDTSCKTSNTDNPQTTKGKLYKPAERAQPKETVKEEAKDPVKDIHVAKEAEAASKSSVSKTIPQPSNDPALPAPLLPDPKRDLSFLKPSRRTSSHYVASAINKYTPKTSAKPSSIPNVPDSSASVKTPAIGFQRSGRSIQVNPHQSSQSSSSDNKENDSASKPNPSAPKRSTSSPECVSESQRPFGEVRPDKGGFGSCAGSAKGSSNTLETERAKNKKIQSSGPIQINVTANNDRDDIKHVRPRSPVPAQSSPPHSSAKPPTASKSNIPSTTRDVIKTVTHLTPDARPQPSVAVSDGVDTSQPVTVFGPIKKFRPVISRSVEKETSLHSSLMEAIQTGGGRDRLKKLSASGPSCRKKDVEEENERSALLAAIRAQNTSGRLKKVKSEAADELEKFKKVASVEERRANPPSSPSLTSTSPPVFPPPPPPPAPMVAPPPPPPVLPQGKLSTVAHPSANTPVNPALAREAMLEAIRSGSAADGLKKIGVPTKTVQVNGKLGTIQATSSAFPRQ